MNNGSGDKYFEITEIRNAKRNRDRITSNAFGIPFVTIDRPSYGGTSSILPIPQGSDFTQESALTLHHSILPKLWSTFGVTNGCNCIVLLCHSSSVMVGVATAAMHAQDKSPLYPLGGLIASGMGDTLSTSLKDTPPSYAPVDDDHARMTVEQKDAVMFKPSASNST
jgi:hypothetical protein